MSLYPNILCGMCNLAPSSANKYQNTKINIQSNKASRVCSSTQWPVQHIYVISPPRFTCHVSRLSRVTCHVVTCCGHLDILRTDVDLPLGPVNAFVHWHSGFLPFQFVTQSYCHYLKQEKRKRTLRRKLIQLQCNAPTHIANVNLSYVRYDMTNEKLLPIYDHLFRLFQIQGAWTGPLMEWVLQWKRIIFFHSMEGARTFLTCQ